MVAIARTTRASGTRIHPTASVDTAASLGDSVRVWHEAQVREGAVIGDGCIIGKGAYIDTNVRLGPNCKVQNYALIYHGVTLGAGVFIGPAAILTNDRRPRAVTPLGVLKGADDWACGEIVVDDGASIGAGAIVLPGVCIGRFALIGAGAVVTHDVPPHALVYGNPGHVAGWVCRCGENLLPGGVCRECGDRFEGVCR